MDDSTSGFDTVFVAYDFYLKVESMMLDADFNFQNSLSRKFIRINPLMPGGNKKVTLT